MVNGVYETIVLRVKLFRSGIPGSGHQRDPDPNKNYIIDMGIRLQVYLTVLSKTKKNT